MRRILSERKPLTFRSTLYKFYDLCYPSLRSISSSPWVIRRLFGVRLPRGMYVRFDPTTVLLSQVLPTMIDERDQTGLEVGIGQAALISLSIALRHPIQMVGVDCSSSRIEQALQVAHFNGVNAHFFTSDLFSAISPKQLFDLIVFNPPYVPTQTGRRLRLTERLDVDGDQVWDGGSDGTEVLSRFLEESKDFLSERGRILFGVQPIFVPDHLVLATIQRSGLTLLKRKTRRLIPSVVYIVAKVER